MLSDAELQEMAGSLVEVPGVTAVTLGGSRARGTAFPDSDVDLGLYYRPPLDLVRLRQLAGAVGVARTGFGPPELTQPGAWGPWVDGGGWLTIEGVSVDWIYRDLDRVQRSWQRAESGVFSFHFQVGHPFGVPDFAYAGEVALGVLLADPSGELSRLKEQMVRYPPKLGQAIVDRLAEARLLLDNLPKSAQRRDVAFVAGSLFRVIGLCAHAIHAKAGRWVITEKGLIEAAGTLPDAPGAFSQRADDILAGLGTDPASLRKAIASAGALLGDVAAAVTYDSSGDGSTASESR